MQPILKINLTTQEQVNTPFQRSGSGITWEARRWRRACCMTP